MKKLVVAVMCVALATATCAFTACSPEKGIGVIDGNYKETDAVKLSAAVEGLEINFGDSASEGIGFEFATDTEFTFDMAQFYSVSASANLGYKFVAGISGEELTLAGAGSGRVAYSSKTAGTTVEAAYSADVYNDSQYLYLDAKGGDFTQKCKIDFEEIIGGIIEDDGYYTAEDNDGDYIEIVTPVSDISLSEIVDQLEVFGAKFYMDDSDGLKIKVSFSVYSVDTALVLALGLIAQSGLLPPDSTLETIENALESIKYDAVKLDFYFSFDAEGNFVQYGHDIDLGISVDVPAYGEDTQTLSLRLKSGAYIKAYSGTVILPEGLADDESYEEIFLPAM